MMTKIATWIRALFVAIIRLYQSAVSPYLGGHCRFQPSCSEYAIQAIEEHGVVRGLWLSIRRILRCHPFSSSGGWDPVPLSDPSDRPE